MGVRFKHKVTCTICGKTAKPKFVTMEFLIPRKPDSPKTQFIVVGQCNHEFKMSAEEMNAETLSELIKEPLWQRVKRVVTG